MADTDTARFWSKVEKRGPDECWPWLGNCDGKGYGTFYQQGKNRRATHVAWEIANGAPFPKGMLACHRCDNPPCVNPAHLFVGDHTANALDMVSKGRAFNQRKTHCPHGHRYSEANIYYHLGTRHCLECKRAAALDYMRNRRALERRRHPPKPKRERIVKVPSDRRGRDGEPVNYARGSAQGLAKLTETQVVDIRRRLEGGERGADLAREFGVHKGLVWQIKMRRVWTHV